LVLAHHPHSARPEHVSQSVLVEQVSVVLPPHEEETQSQSEQLPVDGPPEVPLEQVDDDAHHPHDARAVQSLQVLAVLHESLVLPPQSVA
jgi:hypothetical protein